MLTPVSARSATLDAVRGVAIGLIVIWHLFVPLMPAPLSEFFSLSWTGVDLFFVLSGFLIGGILMDNAEADHYFIAFYGRRIFRIVPLYLVLLALVAVRAAASHSADAQTPGAWVGPEPWLALTTFTQNIVWGVEGRFGSSWLAPTWSLAVEEQFYLLLPALIRFTPSRRWPYLFAACALLAPLARLGAVWLWGPHAAYQLMPGRCDSLFLGVLCAWIMRQPGMVLQLRENRGWLALLVAALAAGLPFFTGPGQVELQPKNITVGLSWFACFYAALLVFLVTGDEVEQAIARYARWLCFLGIGAYSMYLFHIVAATGIRLLRGEPGLPGLLSQSIAVVVLCLLAFASWILLERPAINFARRRFAYGRASAAHRPVLAAAAPVAPALDGAEAALPGNVGDRG